MSIFSRNHIACSHNFILIKLCLQVIVQEIFQKVHASFQVYFLWEVQKSIVFLSHVLRVLIQQTLVCMKYVCYLLLLIVSSTLLATLPVVTSKPRGMSKEDWEHLSSLSFGLIMFASPAAKDAPSLPDLINASDLDGDIFLTIWHPVMLQEVGNLRPGRALNEGPTLLSKFNLDENVLLISDNGHEEAEEAVICLQYADGLHYDIYCEGRSVPNVHEGRLKKMPNAQQAQISQSIVAIKGNQVLLSPEKTTTVAKMRASDPYLLAQYVLENNLMKQKRWKWCKKYVTAKKIVHVSDVDIANAMATVLWDGDEETGKHLCDSKFF